MAPAVVSRELRRALATPGRLGIASGGIALVALPFAAPELSVVHGAPWLAAAGGVAALLLAASLGTRLRRAGAWAALAVVGQAAALQAVRAGSAVGYQHFRVPPPLDSPASQLAAVILLAQAAAVIVAVARSWPRVRERLLGELGRGRIALLAVVFVLTSATLSPTVSGYLSELAFATTVQALSAATVAAAAISVPTEVLSGLTDRTRAWLGETGDGSGRSRLPLVAAVIWVAGTAAFFAIAVYERHPHLADEVVYLLQARYLAAGKLSLPVPPVPAGFELDLMFLDGGRWYSPVPPGWPAVLAVGAFLGTPWLVNPVLAGLSVILAHRLLTDLYDDATARTGTLLLAFSPWFLFLSMSVMTHTAQIAAALGGAVAVARARDTGRLRWAVAGGAGAGVVALVRPLDGLIVGVVLGCWALTLRGRSWRLAPAAAFAAGAATAVLPLLAYNAHFTGDPAVFPITEYIRVHYGPGANALGFGPDRGLGWGGFDPFPGHDLKDALINTNLNAFALNVELFGWGAGSLLPALLLAASRRLRGVDLAMAAVVVLVVVVYAFYWSSGGPDFGPRYWSLVLLPCVALTARALPLVGRLLRPSDGRDEAEPGGTARGTTWARGALALGLAVLAATVTFLPWRAIDKYHDYRGMQPGMRSLAAERDFGNALVLVEGPQWPDYTSAAVYNPLDLRAPGTVYAWDRGADVRRALLAAYPDRAVWRVEGPSRTGDGYRVVGHLRAESRRP